MKHTKAQGKIWQAAYYRALNASYGAGRFGVAAHAQAIRAGDAAVKKACRGKRCVGGKVAG